MIAGGAEALLTDGVMTAWDALRTLAVIDANDPAAEGCFSQFGRTDRQTQSHRHLRIGLSPQLVPHLHFVGPMAQVLEFQIDDKQGEHHGEHAVVERFQPVLGHGDIVEGTGWGGRIHSSG